MAKGNKDTTKLAVVLCLGTLFLLHALSVGAYAAEPAELSWPKTTRYSRPWTYWWWLGSAVDEPNLTEQLEAYHKAGMGGVHIIPIYGVIGQEERFIDYLSPRWMQMLAHTTAEANRLDMGVDISTGTGWPFGGPNVTVEDATAKVIFRTYIVDAGNILLEPVTIENQGRRQDAHLQALMAFSDKGEILDLTAKVDGDGHLDWVAPGGNWKLYAVFQGLGGKKVERAAPGGVGYVLDPFSRQALQRYLEQFDGAFGDYKGPKLRAHYHDSYEYGRATWTDNLFEEFEARRGYDLRRQLPALLGEGPEDVVARVKCDYRETVADLHLESYIEPWVQWCHGQGSVTRNQAHGSPSNLLDTYAAADIPETEIFGHSGFEIPGLRLDEDFDFHDALNDPLMLKFASSSAHVTGKALVSSESCTWLGEHFKVALSQVKPEIDQLFVSGINHVFYSSMAYSPFTEDWPGRLFYASTNFAPSNSFWRDISELNAYIARCQSVLQSGRPDNDILLYWPIYDIWHDRDGMLKGLAVHGISGWLYGSGFHETARLLWNRGYSFDYISDRQLTSAKAASGDIQTAGNTYRVLVVPQCRLMPLRTLTKLMDLARDGATIVVHGQLPSDVPGLGDLKARRERFRTLRDDLQKLQSEYAAPVETKLGNGRFLLAPDLESALRGSRTPAESIVDRQGLKFIRRKHSEGHHYFLTNLGREHLDGWVGLSVSAESVVLFDPLTGKAALVAVRKGRDRRTQVYLQLQPGRSLILRTFASRDINGLAWRYLRKTGESHQIKGTWQVTFIAGGPKLPASFQTQTLASWTQLGDDQAKRFAGTALYKIAFDKPSDSADDWVLDLGRVCESARVRINGRYVGTLWSIPFEIPVGEFLHEGENLLEVEVTNLSANRIADLDRRKVNWKKFYEINFVNIKYRKFDASDWPLMDSGLLGPVRLIRSTVMEPGAR
ncbi:MAG: glycosyl hydrolase [Planctomycetota bacterium]|jgi:hypothetical protein